MLKDNYIKNSQIPKRYLEDIKLVPSTGDYNTFKDLKNIKSNIKEFVSSGTNILICSNMVGNGKTTWATKLLKEYIEQVSNIAYTNKCPALFINVTNFLNKKKLAISDKSIYLEVMETEKNILSANLVVFDDVAVKNISDYDMGNLYYWIDERTSNLKSCIFTSNLLPEQLRQVLDDRLYSRIIKYSNVYYIKDGDSRGC